MIKSIVPYINPAKKPISGPCIIAIIIIGSIFARLTLPPWGKWKNLIKLSTVDKATAKAICTNIFVVIFTFLIFINTKSKITTAISVKMDKGLL